MGCKDFGHDSRAMEIKKRKTAIRKALNAEYKKKKSNRK